MSDTMLVGVDGSEGSRRAVEFALTRARLSGARLVIACVVDWSPFAILTHEELETRHLERQSEIDRAQTQVLKPLIDALDGQGVAIETLVRHGHASRVLIDLTKEFDVCQIFVGRLGRSRLAELLFGSTTSNLVQAAPVPVTVVP